MNNKLQELAERLEKATGPDRELDELIWDDLDACRSGCPISYTSFVDAALALVERLLPGCEDFTGFNPTHGEHGCGYCVLTMNGKQLSAAAPTRALAILRALVSALIAKESV